MYTNCNYQVNSIDKGLTIIQLTFNFLYPNFIVTKAYIPLLHLVIIYVCASVLELFIFRPSVFQIVGIVYLFD